MRSAVKYWLRLIAFIVMCCGLCLQICLANKAHKTLFTLSGKPPPGFEKKPTKLVELVDVYYGNRYVGYFMASITSKGIRFHHPSKMLSKLKQMTQLKQENILKGVLSQPLPLHQALSCHQAIRPARCGHLSPLTLGVIYDEDLMRADLFIHSSYLKPKRQITRYLPDSSAGLSYSNRILGLVVQSGDAGSNSYYNLTTDSTIAFGNSRLHFSASVANNLLNNRSISLNSINIQSDQHQYHYALGLIETDVNFFFSSLKILVGKFGTTLNTLADKSNITATQLPIFLALPSQVLIFKQGTLIYAKHLVAGHQNINTEQFPEGSYSLTIRISDIQGNTRKTRRYFTKSPLLPPTKIPQYHVTLGYLLDDYRTESNELIAGVLRKH